MRRIGQTRLESWLRHRKVRGATDLATKAIQAAQGQHTTLPAEALTTQLIATLAGEVMALNEHIRDTDKLIEGRFRRHRHAELITSLPGIGTLLGAEFLAATGGDLSAFTSADHLAGFAGLAPAPRDSGRVQGNLHRPQRKRSEGKHHTQAVLALARRRVNVLRALLGDGRCYQHQRDAGGDASFAQLVEHGGVVDAQVVADSGQGPAEVVEVDGIVDLVRREAAAAHRHAVPMEDGAHRSPFDPEPVTELVHRRPGRVSGDQLLDLIGVELSGAARAVALDRRRLGRVEAGKLRTELFQCSDLSKVP